ncbi:hypothetical protein FQR65_LT14613 [Abscondita terminalis]|nr:hypothetical protein FQR65_LT14613 [Abscondita terminalis]
MIVVDETLPSDMVSKNCVSCAISPILRVSQLFGGPPGSIQCVHDNESSLIYHPSKIYASTAFALLFFLTVGCGYYTTILINNFVIIFDPIWLTYLVGFLECAKSLYSTILYKSTSKITCASRVKTFYQLKQIKKLRGDLIFCMAVTTSAALIYMALSASTKSEINIFVELFDVVSLFTSLMVLTFYMFFADLYHCLSRFCYRQLKTILTDPETEEFETNLKALLKFYRRIHQSFSYYNNIMSISVLVWIVTTVGIVVLNSMIVNSKMVSFLYKYRAGRFGAGRVARVELILATVRFYKPRLTTLGGFEIGIHNATVVTSAFQKDCETLLLAFERANDLSFKAFSDAWKKFHFNLMFNGLESTAECTFFTETCFFTIKKYIVFSQNVAIQIGALYMLYSLYYKQHTLCKDNRSISHQKKVKIRCTYEDFAALTKLVDKMHQRELNEAVFVFTKLKIDNAFRFVALPQVYGLEGKFLWQERNPVYDVKSTLFSSDFYGLGLLNEVSEDYARGLEKYGFAKKDCDRISDLAEDVQALCKEMESEGCWDGERGECVD